MKKTTILVGKVALYVNPNTRTMKLGSKGKATPAADFFGTMSKGEARKLRKLLSANGYGGIASVSRTPGSVPADPAPITFGTAPLKKAA